jgi:septal ring factor EnvC (AmiA/AmiB activator)
MAEQTTQQRLEQIRSDIGELKKDLGGDKKQQQQFQQELARLENEIAVLSRKQRHSTAELKKQQQNQRALTAEVVAQRQVLVRQQQNLDRQIRAGYTAGQQNALKLLLNQTDPAAVGRNMTYYGYFARARLSAIGETRETIDRLSNSETRLKRSTEKLKRLQADLEHQEGELKQRRSKRKLVLAGLNAEISSKEQRLNRLLEDERALGKLLEEIAPAGLPPTGAFVNLDKYRGKLKWPVKGVKRNRFGASRNQGRMRWQGIIIAGKEGQDIHAVAPGQVVFADWIRGYGLLLIVDHGNGYMSLYGQNQALYKDVGERVSADEVIAALGNSGGKDDYGLYFEMRHKGKPVDPATWCR